MAPSPALEVAVFPHPPPRRLTGETPLLSAPPGSEGAEALLRDRQRGYKLAALRAKQRGDLEAATKFYRVAKVTAAGPGFPSPLETAASLPFLSASGAKRGSAGPAATLRTEKESVLVCFFSLFSCFFRVLTPCWRRRGRAGPWS